MISSKVILIILVISICFAYSSARTVKKAKHERPVHHKKLGKYDHLHKASHSFRHPKKSHHFKSIHRNEPLTRSDENFQNEVEEENSPPKEQPSPLQNFDSEIKADIEKLGRLEEEIKLLETNLNNEMKEINEHLTQLLIEKKLTQTQKAPSPANADESNVITNELPSQVQDLKDVKITIEEAANVQPIAADISNNEIPSPKKR